jgi:predicted HTH domain antitoxin
MVVFDASTLILIAKAELLEIVLASIGLEVAIPKEVEWECCAVKRSLDALMKTMSIRMDRENYEFLHELTKEEPGDLSKAVRDLVYRGRIMLAVERYKKGEASLGRAAALAGVPVGQMMTILTEYGVESRVEKDDYLLGLESLRKLW